MLHPLKWALKYRSPYIAEGSWKAQFADPANRSRELSLARSRRAEEQSTVGRSRIADLEQLRWNGSPSR